ncbi:Por secretion system C-terminal sorting domain-containing protein [Flexibacter flexilis DSM 6793]|uniref:Por secretion system C-terminal sorting domain-containing protein n=1 Tax=Flexibacter flexilis DSM 6793 TaxID=927664 RepID=A0A1I1MG70_9BACT|nr:M4 family metallopeptidase [Flexibacter flexilis]SFC84136.1 Por secretion system C-terminal sorting domain-containing protein [Flexibacter flexilis DSM 6793]
MKKNYTKSAALAALLLGTTTFANAQQRLLERVNASDGKPSFARFDTKNGSSAVRLSQGAGALKQLLQAGQVESFARIKSETDQLGMVHEKYQQFYKGIKVEFATYTLHAKNGLVETASGDYRTISDLSITPSLSEAQALAKATKYIGAKSYKWENRAEAAWFRANTGKSFDPKGELVICPDYYGNEAPRLAYKFDIYAQQPISRDYVYVDAQSGKILYKEPIIKHANAVGSADTRYSGTKNITADSYSSTYRLRETSRGLGIETYNCKKGSSYTAAVDFTDANNTWTATEFNNTAMDNAALDAHWGAEMTYDYWSTVHGRNSYDNAGAKIKSYVHFDDDPSDGVGFENAYWDGSVMTYGDGATRFKPLTSLDVCAHEIGHAVCEKTANLAYQKESGALNEGFSDIWGAAVEYYAAPTKSTWLIGEDIDKQRPSLRSMSNPNAEGQPDTYGGTYWQNPACTPTSNNDYCGVHTNSGVLNYWFYLLSVGGSGTNDIGSAFTVTGITIDKAAKIAFRAESLYLTANATFVNTRQYTIQAATELYGAASNEVIQTTNAWYAVGVGAAYSTTPPPTSSYCASKGNTVTDEWIDLVQLGTISRTSTADAGYKDATSLSTNLTLGAAATISFSAGFASTAYTEYWRVWIDYNKDNDFDDAGELVVSTSSSSAATLTGTFTVPTTASTGATRMRVSMKYNAAQTGPCETFSYGEVEDYTVNLATGTTTPPTTVTYCASKGNSVTDEWIDLVQLGTISRTSTADAGYKDATSLSTNLTKGASATISFSAGFASTAYTEYWRVWIDYNKDGDFADAGEQVVATSSSSAATLTGTFTVPATASTGSTRMRVSMKYNAAQTSSCETFSYGEVEDYTVNIVTAFAPSTLAKSSGLNITTFPNPASSVITLQADQTLESAKVRIHNTIGALMYEGEMSGTEQEINVSELSAGVYVISVQSEQGLKSFRFIKQ